MASPAPVSATGHFTPRNDWLARHVEEIIEPNLPIVDPHHHLVERPETGRYLLPELLADTNSGHNIIATVYLEWLSMYRATGPAEMKSVGEIEFANGVAAMAASGAYGKTLVAAGIVGHANLSLGDGAKAVLEAEIAAGNGRFRGIRHSSPWDADESVGGIYSSRPKGLLLDPTFRKGFAQLAPLGLSFDAWLFYTQLNEFVDLARAFPETRICLDHCGGIIGIGGYANRREEIFKTWKASIQEVAKCPNVVVKLGGLAMVLPGFGFHEWPKPPNSEQAAAAWKPYLETCIEAFGPDRCMFESNFPPDKGQCSYQVIFNAFKRIAANFSESEKTKLFSKTATDFYRLQLP
jgi:predicted TIM-barrel fold metal-dependent hydrolase